MQPRQAVAARIETRRKDVIKKTNSGLASKERQSVGFKSLVGSCVPGIEFRRKRRRRRRGRGGGAAAAAAGPLYLVGDELEQEQKDEVVEQQLAHPVGEVATHRITDNNEKT